jgi:glycerophosphoryl diester phosphodiesterase
MAPVIGHRGAAGLAPENTLEGLEAAAAIGVRWVEVDVRHSADGVPVIFHDDDLGRCTGGSGAPEEHPWAHLCSLDAGRWFDPRFAGARIPTLDALLGRCRELGLGVNLELKLGPHSRRDRLLDGAAACLARFGASAPELLVSSFDAAALAGWRRLRPQDPVGLICTRPDAAGLEMATTLGASTLHPDWRHVTADTIAAAHAAGLSVYAWTCNDPAGVIPLRRAGLDGVFTDRPDRFLSSGFC